MKIESKSVNIVFIDVSEADPAVLKETQHVVTEVLSPKK